MQLRFLPFLALAAVACSTGPSEHAPQLDRTQSAIINGARDTTHPAVVALVLGEGAPDGTCSGTIVKTDPARHIGWVATAAHCVEHGVFRVVQAEDFAASDGIYYSVLDYEADPRWATTGRSDFAVVRIGGVDASTPVIPLATAPDGLTIGTKVTSIGYGVTGESSGNTKRNAIEKPIAELTSELVGYDQATGGVCFGDSGGPVIAGSGASARVVAIHSFVEGGCDVRGFSARVTSNLPFLDAQLAKAPTPSCEQCRKIASSGAGACAAIRTACLEDDDCRKYEDCVAEGKKDEAACAAEYPLAQGPSVAAASCACGGPCAELCAGAPACADVGRCGARIDEAAECASCVESACCEEQKDCTADGRCHLCLERDDTFPSCEKNAPRAKLAACATDKCAAACAGAQIATLGKTAPAPASEAPPAAVESDDGGCSTAPGTRGTSWLGFVALGALAFVRRRTARPHRA